MRVIVMECVKKQWYFLVSISLLFLFLLPTVIFAVDNPVPLQSSQGSDEWPQGPKVTPQKYAEFANEIQTKYQAASFDASQFGKEFHFENEMIRTESMVVDAKT